MKVDNAMAWSHQRATDEGGIWYQAAYQTDYHTTAFPVEKVMIVLLSQNSETACR